MSATRITEEEWDDQARQGQHGVSNEDVFRTMRDAILWYEDRALKQQRKKTTPNVRGFVQLSHRRLEIQRRAIRFIEEMQERMESFQGNP